MTKTMPKFGKLENITTNLEGIIDVINQELLDFGRMRVNFEQDLHSSQVKSYACALLIQS